MRKTNNQTIGSLYTPKDNFFDFLRFVFATMVIYFHSFPLFFGLGKVSDPIATITQGQAVMGPIAVSSFLVISGFLVTQSLVKSKNFLSYFIKRLLRLMPALIAATALAAFIVGPIITSLSMGEYFSGGLNNPYRFAFDAITLNLFEYQRGIKDLFLGNPYPATVNGSMWTLKHEFLLYLMLPLVFYFRKMIKIEYLIFIIMVSFFFLTFLQFSYALRLPYVYNNHLLPVIGSDYDNFIRLATYFFYGSFLYVFREKIACNLKLITFALVVLLVSFYLHILFYGMILVLPYLIVAAGVNIKFSSFKKYGDFSYGLYIYAFPVQQTLIFLFRDKIGHLGFFVLSFLSILLVAFISWHLIENPCLKQKNKIALFIQNKTWLSRISSKKDTKQGVYLD